MAINRFNPLRIMKFLGAALVLSTVFGTGLAHAARYTVTELGDLPGGDNSSVANAFNDLGQIVGYSATASGPRAFIWDAAGGMRQLFADGTPATQDGQTVFPQGWYSQAEGINNAGQVVGSLEGGSFIWDPRTSTLTLPASNGIYGINHSGQYISMINPATGIGGRGFVETPGQGRLTLGTLAPNSAGGTSMPLAINELGQAVGTSNTNGFGQAVRWDSAGNALSLNATPGEYYYANASAATVVNNLGQIAGWRQGYGYQGAFSWTEQGGIVDLGVPAGAEYWESAGSPTGINDAGQIVGSIGRRGYIWTAQDGMVILDGLLDDVGYITGFSPTAINNAGQIIGVIARGDTISTAVLLTPVPEAATWWMAGVGCWMTLVWRRRTRQSHPRRTCQLS